MLHTIDCMPAQSEYNPGDVADFSFQSGQLTPEQILKLQFFDGFLTHQETGNEIKLLFAELLEGTLRLGISSNIPTGHYTVTAAYNMPTSEMDVWQFVTVKPIQIGDQPFVETKPVIQTINLTTGGNIIHKDHLDTTVLAIHGENLQLIDSVTITMPFRLSVLRVVSSPNLLTLRCLSGQAERFRPGMGILQMHYHSFNEQGSPVVDTLMVTGKVRFQD